MSISYKKVSPTQPDRVGTPVQLVLECQQGRADFRSWFQTMVVWLLRLTNLIFLEYPFRGDPVVGPILIPTPGHVREFPWCAH